MKEYIINYEDLTESREILYAREPKFMGVFIYLIFLTILGIFLWSWFGVIEDTVKAQGYVLPTDNVSIIRNTISGYIKEINYKDGQKVNQGDVLYLIENRPFITEKTALEEQITKIKKEIDLLLNLEHSIKVKKNLLKEKDSEYYYWFETYKFNYDQYLLRFNEAKCTYLREKDLAPEIVSFERVQTLEAIYKESETNLNKFESETLSKIKSELFIKQNQLLQNLNSISLVEQKISLSRVCATISGIVQVVQIINQGEYIPEGIEVLKIVPSSNSNYRINILVENRNIGLLKIGQNVKYNFQTFPYQEFGFGTGEIVYISKDINRRDNMLYRVEGTLKESSLLNRAGEEGKIKPGMLCEARVIVRKKKIIQIVLEKLGLWYK